MRLTLIRMIQAIAHIPVNKSINGNKENQEIIWGWKWTKIL